MVTFSTTYAYKLQEQNTIKHQEIWKENYVGQNPFTGTKTWYERGM